MGQSDQLHPVEEHGLLELVGDLQFEDSVARPELVVPDPNILHRVRGVEEVGTVPVAHLATRQESR